MSSPYRTSLLLLFGLIVVALVGAAAWRGQLPDTSFSVVPSISPTPSQSIEPAPPSLTYTDPDSSWGTFSSVSLGYSIAVPPQWVRANCDQCIGWRPANASAQAAVIGVTIMQETVASVLERAKPFLISSEAVTFQNITWTRLFLRHPETRAVITTHFTEHNGKLYELGLSTENPESLSLYATMVRSFRTLSKNSSQ